MRSVKAVFKPLVRATLRALLSKVWPLRKDRKRVLLASHNILTAGYLRDLMELFREDSRLDFWLCLKRRMESPNDRASLQILPVPTISHWLANLVPWDLVVMADHAMTFQNLAAPWRHPVLRISHGIGSKKFEGEEYFYGPKLRDSEGRLIYTCLFESSYERQKQALAASPDLLGKVCVVGSLRADRLTDAVRARRAAKAGGCDARPCVLIASSWGPGNLFEKWGVTLVAEAERLFEHFQFTLRPHPHLLRDDGAGAFRWTSWFQEQAQRGFRWSRPEEPVTDALAAADVLIIDDMSSVGLFAILAEIPVIWICTGSATVTGDSLRDRLRQSIPSLDDPGDLSQRIRDALSCDRVPQLRALAATMNSEPGNSAKLMREQVYRLLQLREKGLA